MKRITTLIAVLAIITFGTAAFAGTMHCRHVDGDGCESTKVTTAIEPLPESP